MPASALIEPLAYTFDGDFSSCESMTAYTQFSLLPSNQVLLSAPTNGGSLMMSAPIIQTVGPDATGLKFTTSCRTGGIPGTALPIPSFDASLTFQWTVRDTTPTRSFN